MKANAKKSPASSLLQTSLISSNSVCFSEVQFDDLFVQVKRFPKIFLISLLVKDGISSSECNI